MDQKPVNKKHILLTGGTGLIGTELTRQLLAKGYTVSHLSRSSGKNPAVKTFLWDVETGVIDVHCIDGVDMIVHLAGAGIAEKHWSQDRKMELVESRTKSIQMIYDLLKTKKHKVKNVISASAIGYYSDRGNDLMDENSAPYYDFLAQCCIAWEAAVDEGKKLGLRVTKFRTGVVLDKGGALAKMALPIKFYVGAPLGSGKQWVSWIHLQDVIGMYLFAAGSEDMEGVYDMVAPNPVTNKQLTQCIAKQLHKPLWMPNIPAFLLNILLGEMSTVVLGSTKVSAQKIEEEGYKFKFAQLSPALKEIYG